jgi:hypothetical protein
MDLNLQPCDAMSKKGQTAAVEIRSLGLPTTVAEARRTGQNPDEHPSI